ncbi:MAG: YkgJ family cysteine cluster protein [Pyrinomonadaceae bacterium]|nr:YkgJ family cysteine cluster protein [Pyrinomonadaceae bacterium]
MENEDWVTGNVRLNLGGQPLDLQMTVPAKPVKPQRMLPIFQQMATAFIEMSETAIENAGGKISCQKGCAACCRQAIPLAEIEAYQIAEIVAALPEPRRSEIEKRFETAWHHFADRGWFERLDESFRLSPEERNKVIVEYFNEKIDCPFLEDEACSIHPTRPLACREYLVTSPAENCLNLSAETVRMVELPVKTSDTVRKISNSAELNSTPANFVPLVLALEWTRKKADEFPEKTGEQWMADFFRNLTNSEIPSKG